MRRINLCMSGGRTSAYMVEKVLKLQSEGYFEDVEFVITFANTGREHEETLRFVNECDKRWRELYEWGVIWLEAVVHEGRKPCSHKMVTFETASRFGEPFEEVVKKYGLPNKKFLHCTRELKENPIMSYMESLGERKGHTKDKVLIPATYETWIGIRGDEPDRLGGNKNGKQLKVYPLGGDVIELNGCGSHIDLSCDKLDVLDFWEDMPFDLGIPEHLGNCTDCHKKSFKKLLMVIRDMGEKEFYFSAYLDNMYSEVKAQEVDGKIIPRRRFRDYTNTQGLIAMFKMSENSNFKHYEEENEGCASSCEPFMMDNTPEEAAA